MKKEILKELKEYNKFLRSVRLKEMTLEEFTIYKRGKRRVNTRFIENPLVVKHKERFGNNIPTSDKVGNGFVREEKRYTGKNLIGIAVMHKSNLVPVFSKDDAVEISKMRRG